MTDWGIPNWLDQRAYGDTKRWSENRWRWEFIRRREDCRQDFLAHKDGTVRFYEHPGFVGRILRPDEPGFVAKVPGCDERYGLAFFFFQAEDGIRALIVTGSDVCSSD